MIEGNPLAEAGQLLFVCRPICRDPIADRMDDVGQINRQNLDAESLQQIRLVDDRGPEEIDSLPDLADSHRSHAFDDPGRPHEAIDASLKLRVVDAAIVEVRERDAQVVKHAAGGQHSAQRVAQPRAVGQRGFVTRSPEQRRHAAFLGDHGRGAFRAEIAMRNEQGIDPLAAKMLHRRLDVFLIADDPVGQDRFEVRVRYVPSVEPPANLDLKTQRILVRKDKIYRWDKTQGAVVSCSWQLHGCSAARGGSVDDVQGIDDEPAGDRFQHHGVVSVAGIVARENDLGRLIVRSLCRSNSASFLPLSRTS